MLFRQADLEGIAEGRITLAFRRWSRPSVRAGGAVRTAAGVVRIGSIDVIEPGDITPADALKAGYDDLAALVRELGGDGEKPLYRITLTGIEADRRVALRMNAQLDAAEMAELERHFARWEKVRPGCFPAILKAIGDHPEVPAAVLAERLKVEKLRFKQDVRKLKELGLTESLATGYRLSARGEAAIRRLGMRP
jgi:hypothetical protein